MKIMGKRQKTLEKKITDQLKIIDRFNDLEPLGVTPVEREALFSIASNPGSNEVQVRAALLLSKWYTSIAPNDPEFAKRIHNLLLKDLYEPHATLAHPSCSWLVMSHLREENLSHILWDSAAEVATAAECFYSLCGTIESNESHRRVRDLVKYAALHFIRQRQFEEAFQLFLRVPISGDFMDADIFRIRNTLVLWEQKRVARFRRALRLFMACSAVFILVISPTIFWLAEHDYPRGPSEHRVTFGESIYWSVITAMTVGYGDIVPHSTLGKILSLINSMLGITFMGVIAGLILAHITPRTLH
jgi:hypothetical protein